MKKVFLFAMAALTIVACDKKTEEGGTTGGSAASVQLTLTENGQSIPMKVGDSKQLTAVVVPSTTALTWESSNSAYASVSTSGLVTAVAEGNAIISVKAGDVKQSCIVQVTKSGTDPSTKPQLKGSKIWPIIMDGVTSENAAAKIVFDFRPDDVHKFLYVWEATYQGGAASGKNFYQTSNDGDFTSLEVTTLGWAGLGFCMNPSLTTAGYEKDTALTGAIQRLAEAIVATPNDYYLHMAMKGTDAASHAFYVFGSSDTKFGIGTTKVYDAPKLFGDYNRDGSWTEFDIPMSDYSVAMSAVIKDKKYEGMNLFVALTEGVQGYKLNLDAVYFYKK